MTRALVNSSEPQQHRNRSPLRAERLRFLFPAGILYPAAVSVIVIGAVVVIGSNFLTGMLQLGTSGGLWD